MKATEAGAPSLLILDDVEEMREWLRELIAQRYPGWRVRTARSAIEFHRALDRERPRLALLDEVLGAGEDLASLLQIAQSELIPVALMTGMDPTHRNSARLPMGVMRRMVKPDWESGEGTEAFLAEVGQVMALTGLANLG